MKEIILCPFSTFEEHHFLQMHHSNGKYFINCFTCGAQGPSGDSEQEAADKWNTRITVVRHRGNICV